MLGRREESLVPEPRTAEGWFDGVLPSRPTAYGHGVSRRRHRRFGSRAICLGLHGGSTVGHPSCSPHPVIPGPRGGPDSPESLAHPILTEQAAGCWRTARGMSRNQRSRDLPDPPSVDRPYGLCRPSAGLSLSLTVSERQRRSAGSAQRTNASPRGGPRRQETPERDWCLLPFDVQGDKELVLSPRRQLNPAATGLSALQHLIYDSGADTGRTSQPFAEGGSAVRNCTHPRREVVTVVFGCCFRGEAGPARSNPVSPQTPQTLAKPPGYCQVLRGHGRKTQRHDEHEWVVSRHTTSPPLNVMTSERPPPRTHGDGDGEMGWSTMRDLPPRRAATRPLPLWVEVSLEPKWLRLPWPTIKLNFARAQGC